MLVSYVIGKLKEKYVLISTYFFLNLVQMDNFQKIDLFRFMNNFIQVVKLKTFANMHSLHLIVITTEQVILIFSIFLFSIFNFLFIVDFTEFMLAVALTQSGDIDERLSLAFDMYDYNHTGTSKLKFMFFLEILLFLFV